METQTRTPATASEIRNLAGDLDDIAINAIMHTKASASEVFEAVQWLLGCETTQAPHGIVRAVYEILEAEVPPPE